MKKKTLSPPRFVLRLARALAPLSPPIPPPTPQSHTSTAMSAVSATWAGDVVSPFFGFLGAASALVFSCECEKGEKGTCATMFSRGRACVRGRGGGEGTSGGRVVVGGRRARDGDPPRPLPAPPRPAPGCRPFLRPFDVVHTRVGRPHGRAGELWGGEGGGGAPEKHTSPPPRPPRPLSLSSGFGAAYGTAKSGVGIASMGVMRPELVMKSIVPVRARERGREGGEGGGRFGAHRKNEPPLPPPLFPSRSSWRVCWASTVSS